jgi:formylglycine-generating enzyme required for sulfatase activity
LHEFVTGLIDEIDQTGYEQYTALLTAADHSSIPANFVLEHIAVPAYTSLFSVAQHYTHSTDTISALVEHLNCSESEALKKVLMSFIQRNGIDLNAQVPLRDLAIELLSCMGMAHRLHHDSQPYQMDTSASVVLSSNSTPPFIHGWTSAQVQQLQHATARALRCEPIFHDRLRDGNPGPQLVIIPAGRFLMGSPEDEAGRYDDERPHEVVIAQPFALGQYLVTFDEYDRFCAATGREKPLDDWDWGRGRRPVINVDWYDALAYCVWLSEQTGQSYRLPTEAEWEYACRAGTTTPFYFGDTLNTDQANYDGNTTYGAGRKGQYRKQTTPVGQFPANAWGLYDMHGNVYEWTGSDYDEDYSGAEQRYVDASESSARVVRGGSWNSYPYGLRSAYRLRTTPVARYADRGFRLSRSL